MSAGHGQALRGNPCLPLPRTSAAMPGHGGPLVPSDWKSLWPALARRREIVERAAAAKGKMNMRPATILLPLLCLAVGGCGRHHGNIISIANSEELAPPGNSPATANATAGNLAGNAQAPAASHDRVLRTETVSGTFSGWEMGDYLWGHIQVAGREPISAQPGPAPIDLFLDANRGRPVTVEIATVRTEIPEAGGMTEIQRITAARNAAGTAETWWQGLSAADRAAAQRRFEAGPLSSGR